MQSVGLVVAAFIEIAHVHVGVQGINHLDTFDSSTSIFRTRIKHTRIPLEAHEIVAFIVDTKRLLMDGTHFGSGHLFGVFFDIHQHHLLDSLFDGSLRLPMVFFGGLFATAPRVLARQSHYG